MSEKPQRHQKMTIFGRLTNLNSIVQKMKELIIFIIIVAISIVSDMRKAKKKQEEAKRRAAQQPSAPAPQEESESQDEDADDEEEEEDYDALDDKEEDEEEETSDDRMLREQQEAEERRQREKAQAEQERIKQILEQMRRAQTATPPQPKPSHSAPATPKASPRVQLPEEGERSTADVSTADLKANDGCGLTADDARKAVILDAIFHRPEI